MTNTDIVCRLTDDALLQDHIIIFLKNTGACNKKIDEQFLGYRCDFNFTPVLSCIQTEKKL